MTKIRAGLNEGVEIRTPLELICSEHGGGHGLNSREHIYCRNVRDGVFEYQCSDCGNRQFVQAVYRSKASDSTVPGLTF